jgi:hypothetical protein
MHDLTDEQYEIRREIIARASRGEITPTKAETEAALRGVGPLKFMPDTENHDPMRKLTWTVGMTLAWIISKSVDDVRELDNDYRRECVVWRGFLFNADSSKQKTGYELVQERLMTANMLSTYFGEAYEPAIDELWRAAHDGRVTATAERVSDGKLFRLDKDEWAVLQLIDDDGREALARKVGNSLMLVPIYVNPRFRPSEITEHWRAITPEEGKAVSDAVLADLASADEAERSAEARAGRRIDALQDALADSAKENDRLAALVGPSVGAGTASVPPIQTDKQLQPLAIAPVAEAPEALVSDRTGAQGRPSSAHLLQKEFERRDSAEERISVNDTLEAKALLAWFATAYPKMRALTEKTVTNKIPGWKKLLDAKNRGRADLKARK